MRSLIFIIFLMIYGINHLCAQTFNFVMKAGNITKVYPITDIQKIYFSELREERLEKIRIHYDKYEFEFYDMKAIKEITLSEDIEEGKYLMNLIFYEQDDVVYDLDEISKIWFTSEIIQSMEEKSIVLYPVKNYPNPFNDDIKIKFSLTKLGKINISIIDMSGATLRELDDSEYQAGENEIIWDGKDDNGNTLGAGVYYAIINTGSELIVSKMIKIN